MKWETLTHEQAEAELRKELKPDDHHLLEVRGYQRRVYDSDLKVLAVNGKPLPESKPIAHERTVPEKKESIETVINRVRQSLKQFYNERSAREHNRGKIKPAPEMRGDAWAKTVDWTSVFYNVNGLRQEQLPFNYMPDHKWLIKQNDEERQRQDKLREVIPM